MLGYHVWPRLFDEAECQELIRRAHAIVDKHRTDSDKAIFTTDEEQRCDDSFFLASGTSIQCFFEPGIDGQGASSVCNKIGHALHTQDSIFSAFAQHPKWQQVTDIIDIAEPTIVQSMVIFKAQKVGGPVDWHQDACFLGAHPKPVVGLWVALEDANLDNGCLWVSPGGHVHGLQKRYVRDDNDVLSFVPVNPGTTNMREPIPVEVPAGSVVALHGYLPHRSLANRSPRSRCAMTFHVIDAKSEFLSDNWIRCPEKAKLGRW